MSPSLYRAGYLILRGFACDNLCFVRLHGACNDSVIFSTLKLVVLKITILAGIIEEVVDKLGQKRE